MNNFATIMRTQALVKQHLIEARIRCDRKDWAAAVPHLLAALDTQRTTINILADKINHPRRKKAVQS